MLLERVVCGSGGVWRVERAGARASRQEARSSSHGAARREFGGVVGQRGRSRGYERASVRCKGSLFSDSKAFGELLNTTQEDVIGLDSLVRVTREVRIYHFGKDPKGFNLEGHQGVVVDRVDENLTANLPYKVKFEIEVKGKKKKVFAHLSKTEIEVVKMPRSD